MPSFSDLYLDEPILKALSDLKFEKPTTIQEIAIPKVLTSDADLIALAQTGTGKTAAFGLPVLQFIETDNKQVQALILCPTRELCIQITKDFEAFSKYMPKVSVLPVYGGSNITTQISALKRGVQVVVATPGRALDLIKRKVLQVNQVKFVVLDEADEMLNMGFKDELDAILDSTPKHKRTLLFSATMPKEVRKIAQKYMNKPEEIASQTVNSGATTLSHWLYRVGPRNKFEALKRVVDVHPDIYGIVFCRTKRETQDIATQLQQSGYNAEALHGDLSQAMREQVMHKFRNRVVQLLVATDVAARGLDVNDLTHVINYQLPDDVESYTHRSGRTGRAGKKGVSIVIATSREAGKVKNIERVSKVKFEEKDIPTGEQICQNQLFSLIDKVNEIQVDEKQIAPFLNDIYEKMEWLSREELIKRFVSVEFNRFLSYYQKSKDINDRSQGSESSREKRGSRGDMARIHINVGKKQKLNPARLLGIINEALDSSSADVGQIDIMNNFSFFDLEEKHADSFINGLSGVSFEGSNELSAERAKQTKQPNEKSFRGKRNKENSFRGNPSKENSFRGGSRNKKPNKRFR